MICMLSMQQGHSERGADDSPVEAAKGKLIMLQVGGVALLNLILALEVVLEAEGALKES
jgi:hypothetical protein